MTAPSTVTDSTPSAVYNRRNCRACGGTDLRPWLDLGFQPPANAFRLPEDTSPEPTFPLQVVRCSGCGLSQLTMVVSPELLFTHYPFEAGHSPIWVEHCTKLAHQNWEPHGFVVDIASNDGTLLRAFQERGWRVLGVDPSDVQSPVKTIRDYWSRDLARQLAAEYGEADLITATNVLGHVDDVRNFLAGVATLLGDEGTCVIECPHILPLLHDTMFDTIYHEHLSYWSLGPLRHAARQVGLKVYDVQPQAVHGGTMRYLLCHQGAKGLLGSVIDLLHQEQAEIGTFDLYQRFQGKVNLILERLREQNLQKAYGFGASAKGNTLLNAAQIDLVGIFDESPSKQGLVTPGRRIPVLKPERMDEVTQLLLLSWNNAKALKKRAKQLGFQGNFLTPIPKLIWSSR